MTYKSFNLPDFYVILIPWRYLLNQHGGHWCFEVEVKGRTHDTNYVRLKQNPDWGQNETRMLN